MLEAYLNPGTWHVVEEGLYVRATLIPSLATCYVETGEGDYARWGSTTGDFENILPEISYGFVRLDLEQVDARLIDVKQDTKVLNGLKIGLRSCGRIRNSLVMYCSPTARVASLKPHGRMRTRKARRKVSKTTSSGQYCAVGKPRLPSGRYVKKY